MSARPSRRPSRFFHRLISSVFAFLVVSPVFLSQSHAVESAGAELIPEAIDDAELTDVAFANANVGVAVGDRGALWRTADGGRTWTRCISQTDVRLESVSMVNANDAWAVGGYAVPTEIGPSSTVRSQGIVLRTKDGGLTWQSLHQPQLPALTRVKFFTRNQGIAVGASSSLFPSSIFQTSDGGRTWNPLPLAVQESWTDGDFASMDLGCVLGRQGRPYSLMKNALEASTSPDPGRQRSTRLRFGRSGQAWMIGERGFVQTSLDGGRSWAVPRSLASENLKAPCDWQALATFGDNIWIAGAPGSVLLHSTDAGKTWRLYKTGSTVPLRGLCFVDDSHGWAVGSLGTILHTRDGGKTWQIQRAGGKRLAVLALFPSARQIPWEVFAQLAATDGYRTAVELVTREDETKRQSLSVRQRMSQAGTIVGVAATDEYGIVPMLGEDRAVTPDDVTKYWNERSNQTVTDLEERIVRSIRQWRPEIIITSAANPQDLDPVGACVSRIVLSAAKKSGDPAAYAHQLSNLGMAAWKPKRVFAAHGQSQRATVEIHRSQISPKMLSSLAELADQSRGLLGDDSVLPRTLGFDLLQDEIASPPKMRDFFAGLPIAPGSDARRPMTTVVDNIPEISRQVQKRIDAQAMVDRSIENPARAGTWLAQIDKMTHGMSPGAGATLLADAAMRSARSGNREVAAEAFQALVRKYPQSPQAERALAWLVQYYGSAEAAWIYRRQGTNHRAVYVNGVLVDASTTDKTYMLRTTAPKVDPNAARPTVPAMAQAKGEQGKGKTGANGASPPASDPATDEQGEPSFGGVSLAGLNAAIELELDTLVVPASGTDPSDDRYATRADIALDAARSAQRISPALFATPSIQFALASAARQSDRKWSAKPLQTLAGTPSGNPWTESAACELWMAHRKGRAPKKVWACAQASAKPVLDGKLDDAVWKAAQPVALLRGASDTKQEKTNSAPSAAVMMYDAEYLYLGVSCPRADKRDGSPAGNPRKRDSSMAACDRVELFLDVDRDYSTFFHFSIDSNGRTADAFWRDDRWDPTWYVASGGDDDYWTCECAIPWAELTGEAPAADQMWAVGIQRIVPGQALESWTTPASIDISPEGFGLLRFAKPE